MGFCALCVMYAYLLLNLVLVTEAFNGTIRYAVFSRLLMLCTLSN